MNEQSVNIALLVKDRAAQQLTRSMFDSAGARVLLCDDAAAVQAAAERVQAIVLGLNGSAEDTIEAVVILRKQLKTMPIYVVADTAGRRHSQRVKTFGVTEVIPSAQLHQRAPQLVGQLAETTQIPKLVVPSSGWAPKAVDDAYDVESMDLETWLSIPGNRRLLGMAEPAAQPGAGAQGQAPAHTAPQRVSDRAGASPTARAAADEAAHAQSPGPALAEVAEPPPSPGETPGGPSQFPQAILRCREEHAAQNSAILDAHKQRERRLQEGIKAELHRTVTERIGASEAKTSQRIEQSAAEIRGEIGAALRRMTLMIAGLVVLILILAVVVAWRSVFW